MARETKEAEGTADEPGPDPDDNITPHHSIPRRVRRRGRLLGFPVKRSAETAPCAETLHSVLPEQSHHGSTSESKPHQGRRAIVHDCHRWKVPRDVD